MLINLLYIANFGSDVKSLASVILRRNISNTATDSQDISNQDNNSNLWKRLSVDAQNFVKTELLKVLNECKDKTIIHKVCNLVIEVGGTLYEQDEFIWQDLLNLLFVFVNSVEDIQVDAALQIFNGLFSYLMDHLVKYKDDLLGIFSKTLQHQSLDINLAALQAVSNFLQIAEGKDARGFVDLLGLMANVALKAMQQDDETVLEDTLVEFNEIAEIEPKFFRKNFKELFTAFHPIVAKNDYTNNTIRHQPVEFFVTVVERLPNLVKKDQDTLKAMLDLVFKLMIDIDEDIDESWMRPKEGFRADEEEEEDDSVHFGKTCVDRLVSSIGEEIMLPLLSTLVQNTLANTTDWRYKNAGLMALSQVGEYIDDISKIAPMVPVIVQHFVHPNPKIRYAALHCIGQMADDMTEEFQENFHESVLPAIVNMLDDQVPRVQAHACAALTNFFEGTSEETAQNYIQVTMPKLSHLIQTGISIIKENAVTALASLAEASKQGFEPYFDQCISFLCGYLQAFNEPVYKQFKGQVIEAVTIISASVGVEKFRPHAAMVISAMLEIQNKQLDSKDPQKTYLLSAWQRMCLLMKRDFVPFLPAVIPSLFQMATLNPEMSIAGSETVGDIIDVLHEVKPHEVTTDKQKYNITTDEIEEKDVAIQMLAVFIDELGGGFADYIEPASKVLLSMTSYEANDSIRNSVAGALPGLVKCVKEAQPQNIDLQVQMGKLYLDNLWKAINLETETDTLICQVQAAKEIIDEIGSAFLGQDVIDVFATQLVDMYHKSDDRIKENNAMAKNEEVEDEDDEVDQDEIEVIKEENKNEFDLQLSVAEILGIIFKTHGVYCGNLLNELFTNIIPPALSSEEKSKNKFAIYLMDDMVEFLGPNILGVHYVTVAQQIIKYCNSPTAALRQAAAYGIGMMAVNGGAAFAQV